MNWLIVTILSYFFLALVSLFDRYLLIRSNLNPYSYTFFIGISWFFIAPFLIPFGLNFEALQASIFAILAGIFSVPAILFLSKGILKSEVSRVVPAIGGFLPIFTFLLFLFFIPQRESLNLFNIISFFLLISGSILVSSEKFSFKDFNLKNLKYPILSAFFWSLRFFLTKLSFFKLNFATGFFLILIGGAVFSLTFLFFRKIRKQIFSSKPSFKISGLFILGQIFGGIGVLLQNFAVFLAKPFQVPFINALEGTRYVFLIFFVWFLSIFNPRILKEKIRGKILYQKIFSVILIGTGLAILALK